MTEEEKLIEINRAIWGTVDHMFKGDLDSSKLFATGAVLLQTAVELYTITLTDDEIRRILDMTLERLPELRERMKQRLGDRVLH